MRRPLECQFSLLVLIIQMNLYTYSYNVTIVLLVFNNSGLKEGNIIYIFLKSRLIPEFIFISLESYRFLKKRLEGRLAAIITIQG